MGWAAMPGEGARCIATTGPLLSKFKSGRKPPHQAVEESNVQSDQVLSETGAGKKLTDDNGSNPSDPDGLKDHADVVELLLSAGALDAEEKNKVRGWGWGWGMRIGRG